MQEYLSIIIISIIALLFVYRRFFNNTNYQELIDNGAVIIDVRSEGEFLTGNIEGSINIPLDKIASTLNKINDKNQTLITCCASGIRSGIAKRILKSKGYHNIYNGGGWQTLNNKL